jgi:hypothetical protein
LPGKGEQQVMFAFGTTGEGAQTFIHFQTFYK